MEASHPKKKKKMFKPFWQEPSELAGNNKNVITANDLNDNDLTEVNGKTCKMTYSCNCVSFPLR